MIPSPPWPSAAWASSRPSPRRPRELGGASKRVSRRGAVAGAVVCAAQPEEQLDALGSGGVGQRGERRLVVRGGLLVGQRGGRLARSRRLPRNDALGRGERPGRLQMPRDLRGMATSSRRVAALQGVGDRQMQPSAARRRQSGEERLGHERVRERVAVGRSGRGDEPARRRVVERLQHLAGASAGGERQVADVEFEPRHRRQREDVLRRRAESRDATADDFAHARRRAGIRALVAVAQQLVEEEGVAAGLRPQAPRGLRVGAAAPRRHERADRLVVESCQRQRQQRAVAAQVGDRRGGLRVAARHRGRRARGAPALRRPCG